MFSPSEPLLEMLVTNGPAVVQPDSAAQTAATIRTFFMMLPVIEVAGASTVWISKGHAAWRATLRIALQDQRHNSTLNSRSALRESYHNGAWRERVVACCSNTSANLSSRSAVRCSTS